MVRKKQMTHTLTVAIVGLLMAVGTGGLIYLVLIQSRYFIIGFICLFFLALVFSKRKDIINLFK